MATRREVRSVVPGGEQRWNARLCALRHNSNGGSIDSGDRSSLLLTDPTSLRPLGIETFGERKRDAVAVRQTGNSLVMVTNGCSQNVRSYSTIAAAAVATVAARRCMPA